MIRTALRLATLAALTNGGQAPWPTTAQDLFFDSRQEPVSRLDGDPNAARPTGVIFTDQDDGDRPSMSNWSRPLERQIDLLIDIEMATGKGDPDAATYTLETLVTDAELETGLDIFEDQVRRALMWSSAPFSALWRTLHRGAAPSIRSSRYTDPDGHVRLAARQLTIRCDTADECWPQPVDVLDPATATPPAASVTEPLASVLAEIDTRASAAFKAAILPITTVLASNAPQAEVLTRLTTVGLATVGPPDTAKQGATVADPGEAVQADVIISQ